MAPTRLVAVGTLLVITATVSADNYRAFTDSDHALRATVGNIETVATPVRMGVPPMFLIGLDTVSLHWAKSNRAHFQDTGALGYLVESVDESTLDRIRQYLGIDRVFRLPNAQTLLDTLGINHYPVLVDYSHGVITQ